MLVYQPRYRNSELMTKPILPRLKGLHLDSALFTESADLALDVDTTLGGSRAIGNLGDRLAACRDSRVAWTDIATIRSGDDGLPAGLAVFD
jgi:hypothetical protein